MGGFGSGRKSKVNLDSAEIIGEKDGTIISAQEAPEESKARKKTPGGKALKVEEVRAKIFLIFAAAAKFTRRECKYTENDFNSEAMALCRMTEKFPMVGYVLTLFDPVFMALALITKFTRMPSAGKTPAPAPARPEGDNVLQMQR